MKKLSAGILAAVLLMTALCGCQSPLARGIEAKNNRLALLEMDLSNAFSEEEGYHIPNIPWGMTLTELMERSYVNIEKILGVSEDGSSTYSLENMDVALLTRQNDSALVVLDAEGVCTLFSLVFSLDKNDSQSAEKLQLLFDQYLEKLREAFGEATDSVEDESTVDTATLRSITYLWDYTTAEGLSTEVQWAVTYLSGSDEPSYLSLSFRGLPETAEEE